MMERETGQDLKLFLLEGVTPIKAQKGESRRKCKTQSLSSRGNNQNNINDTSSSQIDRSSQLESPTQKRIWSKRDRSPRPHSTLLLFSTRTLTTKVRYKFQVPNIGAYQGKSDHE